MSEKNDGITYRFALAKGGSRKVLEALLVMAVKETELIYGRARRKIETNFHISANRPICTIEGGTECGEHLAKLLSGFLIKQVGENGFRVERLAQWKKSA